MKLQRIAELVIETLGLMKVEDCKVEVDEADECVYIDDNYMITIDTATIRSIVGAHKRPEFFLSRLVHDPGSYMEPPSTDVKEMTNSGDLLNIITAMAIDIVSTEVRNTAESLQMDPESNKYLFREIEKV